MKVIDIKKVNENCKVVVLNKDNEKKVYNIPLNDSKLIEYIDNLIKSKERDYQVQKANVKSDNIIDNLKKIILCYGSALLIAFLIVTLTMNGPEFIGILGYILAFTSLGVGKFVYGNIKDDPNTEILQNIEKEIGDLNNLKTESINFQNNIRKENNHKIEKLEEKKELLKRKKDILENNSSINKKNNNRLLPFELERIDYIVKEYLNINHNENEYYVRKMIINDYLDLKKELYNKNEIYDILKDKYLNSIRKSR